MGETDLLIITHRKAQEVDGVIDAVRAHGKSVERINLCQYPEDITYSWSAYKFGSLLQVGKASVGWFHNPGRYSIAQSLTGHGREIALRECDGFWEGIGLSIDCDWLNHPQSLILSSRKLSQIAMARRLEIKLPDTLVSNNSTEVADFFSRHKGAVAKSIANGYSVYGDEQVKLYSRYFDRLPDDIASGLRFSPMIFQKCIRKLNELRVTCIDRECFGLIADTSDLGDEDIDIRRLNYQNEQARFQGVVVPDDIKRSSLQLMDHFNLSYAGLDWIQDSDGEWYFLELNAMGAFKWSEIQGAGDITTALAKAILRRFENSFAVT
ncbi:hypothetical protein N9L47_10975 [Rhodobacteraceae bacterium]|nr:hypothetical protein [Paracoccaceae bacterium]